MNPVPVLPSPPVTRRSDLIRPRWLAAALAIVLGGAAAYGILTYLGRGPAPVTVTNTSGAATFNFRVTGIPVPGKIEGVKPRLTFSPDNLAATTGSISLELTKLNTGIALRDKHAGEFLGTGKHPVAVFTLNKLGIARQIRAGQMLKGTASGQLSLNGVAVPLTATVLLREAADGSVIEVNTAFNVSFADHQISIPGADPQTDVKVLFRLPLQ